MYQQLPLRWMIAALVVGATFLSVSSAPLLACIFTAAFILWERYTRGVPNRAVMTMAIFAIGYVIVGSLSSRSPIEVLLPFLSLDAWTAYYRILIWQYAMINIEDNPIFGLGLNIWVRPSWMPELVDCLWLTLMLFGGIPTLVFLVGAMVMLFRRVHGQQAGTETPERRQARFGWMAAVLALCLQAFTVHYWGGMHSLFFFVLGLGAWLTDATGQAKSVVEPEIRGRTIGARRALVRRATPVLITRSSRRFSCL